MATMPAEGDVRAVITEFLSAVADGLEGEELIALLRHHHPRSNTFPAEVLFGVAAAALDEIEASVDRPLDLEPALSQHRKELGYTGRREQRLRFAAHAPAALRGGVELDLLAETYSWQSDDLWEYAVVATRIYLAATAETAAVSVPEMCARVARRLELTSTNPIAP